jgi:RNA polymerase sigma-70 factor (ECF subfamily)
MLVTRGRGEVVNAESNDGVVTAGLDAHDSAVVEFERANGQVLFGFVRRLGVADGAAADVVQESLLRLFDALCSGQPIRDLKAWTFHVAYRLAMDEHRRFARRLRLDKIHNHHTASGDPADDLERQQVWSEVDRLPERQRAVLYLRFRADLPFEDIGATLGITASAARSHCTQALAVLRDRLAKQVR